MMGKTYYIILVISLLLVYTYMFAMLTEGFESIKDTMKSIRLLWYIKKDQIQIYPNQDIYIKPGSFQILDLDKYHNYAGVHIIEDESKEELKKIADYLKCNDRSVVAYCDVYIFYGSKLVAKNRKFKLNSEWFYAYLIGYYENDSNINQFRLTEYSSDIISITIPRHNQNPVFFSIYHTDSAWELAKTWFLQKMFDMCKNNSSLEAMIKVAEESIWKCVVFDSMVGIKEEKEVTKENKTAALRANPDIMEKIDQIDEKINQGMRLTGISNLQWKNIVKPNLQEVINKKKLSEKNKNNMFEILDLISNRFQTEEFEEDIETEATLTAIHTFLIMNGCNGSEQMKVPRKYGNKSTK